MNISSGIGETRFGGRQGKKKWSTELNRENAKFQLTPKEGEITQRKLIDINFRIHREIHYFEV
jgi:hypothetical protein